MSNNVLYKQKTATSFGVKLAGDHKYRLPSTRLATLR